jgi:hypothetical protein
MTKRRAPWERYGVTGREMRGAMSWKPWKTPKDAEEAGQLDFAGLWQGTKADTTNVVDLTATGISAK